uniref:non-specific serine/threonine protein kinase n=2 Tax=Quercus lobata TaxID=97700 RepID=A0A7N2LUU2_QUELO
MKLGWNLTSGLNRSLRSWKSSDDPSPGDYTYSVDPRGLPQLVLRQGSKKLFRSGPWYGEQFSGDQILVANTVFKPIFVSNAEEVYYIYETIDNITSRFVLGQSGLVQHFSWNDKDSSWNLLFTVQEDRCDSYGYCGSYGSCKVNNTLYCECLKGFKPKSPQDWKLLDWLDGCVRNDHRICRNGEGFIKLTGLKLPDASQFSVNVSMSIEDCEAECLENCSCTAYAKLDISGSGSGCVTWFGDLLDIREVANYGQDLYVRVAASELEANADRSKKQRRIIIAVTVSVASAVIILASISWFIIWKTRRNKSSRPDNQANVSGVEGERDDLELPLFDMATIEAATNSFSAANKIGAGGFGLVYKGELLSGQEIAVKRLAENSGQGLQEFKNEVILISQLQHRNLVKLLGCCIQGEERMLIYEYMPNRSLDSLIFDEARRRSLNWQKRLDIVIGIARGLLYLHRDSRLRVIHRDLKVSNILLDSEMNPKISDFGMARIFGGNQTESKTKRVVGTYGYMSPEYAIDGLFSFKSDVFSFGVILLEMLSGKKNRLFFHPDHKLNLLGHAWKLWQEGNALDLMDVLLENQFPASEALRYIQVGLLCVQQRPEERPTMPSVLLMLDSESVLLAQPGRPGFYAERCLPEPYPSLNDRMNSSSNEITDTLLEGR